MPRQLPSDPEKRRVQHFKRLYQHIQHFRSLAEEGRMSLPLIVTIPETSEDVYLGDLMVGIESLPPRQREAFELICLQGWTETATRDKMMPGKKWSTPVQQYADTALARMIAAYDNYQELGVVPAPYRPKGKKYAETSPNSRPAGANGHREVGPGGRRDVATAPFAST